MCLGFRVSRFFIVWTGVETEPKEFNAPPSLGMPIAGRVYAKGMHALGPWLRLSYLQSLFVLVCIGMTPWLLNLMASSTTVLCLLSKTGVSISITTISRLRFCLSGYGSFRTFGGTSFWGPLIEDPTILFRVLY